MVVLEEALWRENTNLYLESVVTLVRKDDFQKWKESDMIYLPPGG